MGETTQTTMAADHEAQPEIPEAEPPQTISWALSLPVMAAIVRFITLLFLILTISLLASNSTAIPSFDTDGDDPIPTFNTTFTINSTTIPNPAYTAASPTLHFNDVYAYRYTLSTAVIGLSYTFLLLAFSIHKIRAGGKSPFNNPKLPFYEFVGDKVVLALLATGVGAAFGATVDLKATADSIENAFQLYLGVDDFAPIFAKIDGFFDRAYIPAVFLLIAFITSGVSSLLSSLSLINKISP